MLRKQILFYNRWLKATQQKHSYRALATFLLVHKEQLNNLSKYYK